MRVLALDLGERRIGVALSDSAGVLASPYDVIERSGDRDQDRARIAAVVDETGAGLVVVGLPLGLSGSRGRAAEAASAEADVLAGLLGVPVETFDERLSTVEAERRRRERGPRPKRSRPLSGAQARQGIDAEAAAIFLEAYLATRRQRP